MQLLLFHISRSAVMRHHHSSDNMMAASEGNELKAEEQPLLGESRSLGAERNAAIIYEDCTPVANDRWSTELGRILHLSVPTSTTGVLAYAGRLITTSQVGWLSSLGLSSLALGQTVYNITGLSLVVGVASGITTFVGQAHGAAESHLKGVILQRGLLVALVTAVLPLLAWTQLTTLLKLLGQQPEIASGAASYIHFVSPALLLSAANNCIVNFLAAQSVVRPLVLVFATTTSLTPMLNYFFMHMVGWGYLGAAATLLVLQAVELLLLLIVAIWHNTRQPAGLKPWAGFTAAPFGAVGPYLSVALPSAAMICLDWWAFEALTLLAGLLADAETAVAATGICFGLHVIVFMLIDGVAIAVSIRVANELGASRPAAARDAVVTGVCLGLATTLVCIAPLQALPERVASVFSNDHQVVNTVLACLPGLLISLIGDSINNVLSGCIRGAGRQALGSVVNLGAFWGLGLPLAACMALHLEWGAEGLWWAMAVTSSVQAVVLSCVVMCMDWKAEAVRSERLVRSQSSHGGSAPLL